MFYYVIGVDFDGTLVDHDYPDIGVPVPDAIHYLKEFIALGAGIILVTMRSDSEKQDTLTQAVEYLRSNGVELLGVNVNPTQHTWTNSPKCYCHTYIGDEALGCPLNPPMRSGGRPVADWSRIGPMMLEILHRERARKLGKAG